MKNINILTETDKDSKKDDLVKKSNLLKIKDKIQQQRLLN